MPRHNVHHSPRKPRALRALTLLALTTLPACAQQQSSNLTDDLVNVVSGRLAEAALESWELGTRTQTILEYNATTYSVFSHNALPPPRQLPSDVHDAMQPFFQIAREVVQNRSESNGNISGPQPLIQDGSAADPSSIGMSVLIANWTSQDSGSVDYATAATDQLNFLLTKVPRASDGTISHRVSEVQLWSDFVYMVPPFLAYYAMLSRNRTLLEESYNQIKLYRTHLFDPNVNMWRHVLEGTEGNDEGYWTTGNGWAAAGMLRVWATIHNSEYANSMKNEQKDLINWVMEIHDGVYAHLDDTGLFNNYPDQPSTAQGNFVDGSSTALLASTVYRLALLQPVYKHLPNAERSRIALSSINNTALHSDANSTSPFLGYAHFTPTGFLTPVVNPHSYGVEGNESAEGQAFVVQMHAGWREWIAEGAIGANGAANVRVNLALGLLGLLVGLVLVL
ncbi:Six-hairpin glycosidase-like protein [Cyathus striatus]|nr:Six-hairpin glycosidase-like protein [Cyathus striatus]